MKKVIWIHFIYILVLTLLCVQGSLFAADSVEFGGDSFSFSKDAVIRGFDLPCRSFQIWGDYYIGTGDLDPKDVSDDYKLDNDFTGAQIGLNLGLGAAFLATLYYNYQNYDLDASDSGGGLWTNNGKSHLGGVGLRYNAGGFYFSLIGNYGLDDYKLNPKSGGDTLGYDGWQSGGSFETGYMMSTGGLFTLKPFGNWQYTYLKSDGIDYQTLCRQNDKFSADALFQTIGARVDMDLSLFTIQGRLGWVHQYLKSAPIQTYSFSRTPGTYTPTQAFFEGSAGSDYLWGGAGVKVSLFGMIAASLDYDILFNDYQTTHIGSAGLLWSF